MDAKYASSCVEWEKCPETNLPEYAFIGRSNVGKSSLINMLTGTRGLARTSNTPGKTRLINHFIIDSAWYLVDLPGYGFAKVGKKDRSVWEAMIRHYLINRANLVYIFMLIDVRLEPQQSDLNFIRWMAIKELPFVIVFTKADKLSKDKLRKSQDLYLTALKEEWEELPPIFITSSADHKGKEEVLSLIIESNRQYSEMTGKI
jgi:GTP-binding protein